MEDVISFVAVVLSGKLFGLTPNMLIRHVDITAVYSVVGAHPSHPIATASARTFATTQQIDSAHTTFNNVLVLSIWCSISHIGYFG